MTDDAYKSGPVTSRTFPVPAQTDRIPRRRTPLICPYCFQSGVHYGPLDCLYALSRDHTKEKW